MIHIDSSQKSTQIYLITNCYGDPNKIYIGKTNNESRKGNHKKRFGKDLIFTYIDGVNSLNRKHWKPLESFWIEYFRYLGFDLQNKQMCGGSGVEFHTKDTREKIKLARKGVGKKKIIQYVYI